MRINNVAKAISTKGLARLLIMGLVALTIVGCSSADEVTTTTAPATTTEATTSQTDTTVVAGSETSATSAAKPTPVQGGVILNERQQSGGTVKSTRPVLTPEIIATMNTMSVEDVLANFPRKFAAEFAYEDIKRGGTVRIATTWDISKWDPRMTAAGGTMAVSNMVYMQIVGFEVGPDADPLNPPLVPRIAETWAFNDDATKLTFGLHKGMHWGDIDDPYQKGPEIVAEDIKWAFEELRDNSVHSGAFKTIESIDTPDDYTVVLNFSEPSLWLLPNLAIKDHLMLNPHLFKAGRQDFEAVGPGAFILEEAKKSIRIRLKANPNYYFKDEKGGQLPYVDGVDFMVVTDQSTRTAMLRTSRVETVYSATAGTLHEAQVLLKTNPELIVVAQEATRCCMISFQQNDPMWGGEANADARRAVALAADMKSIVDVVYNGITAPIDPIIPWFFFTDHLPTWDEVDEFYGDYIWHYDPEKAKTLWDSTGYGDITETIEYYAYNGSMADILGLMVQDLDKIGIKIKPSSLDYSAFNGPLAQGSTPGIFWAWSPAYPEPVGATYFRLHKDGTSNRESINDPVLNDLTEQIRGAATSAEQVALTKQILERKNEMVYQFEFPLSPAISLSGYMWRPELKNYRYGSYSGGYYYWGQALAAAWLDQ